MRFGRLASSLPLVSSFAFVFGCGPDGPGRMSTDGSVFGDSGPRDGSRPDGSTDASIGDAGVPTDCTPSAAVDVFETTYLVGGEVPFEAEANVNGVLVTSMATSVANYPNLERVSAFLSKTGTASGLATVSAMTSSASTAFPIARSGSGFLALFDEHAAGGPPHDLFRRTFDANGVPQAADATSTVASSDNETKPSIVLRDSGYAAAWLDSMDGVMTALLDANGAVSGSAQTAAGSIGTTSIFSVYDVGTSARLAYVMSGTGMIRGVSLGSNGAPTGATFALSESASSGSFEIASQSDDAALVYQQTEGGGTAAAMFRAISSDGTASVAEVPLHGVDDEGFEPSIATFAGGYIVAFRFDPPTGNTTLRVLLVATGGTVLRTYDVIDPYPSTGRFRVRVSPDSVPYVVFDVARTLTVGGSVMVSGGAVRAIRFDCQ